MPEQNPFAGSPIQMLLNGIWCLNARFDQIDYRLQEVEMRLGLKDPPPQPELSESDDDDFF